MKRSETARQPDKRARCVYVWSSQFLSCSEWGKSHPLLSYLPPNRVSHAESTSQLKEPRGGGKEIVCPEERGCWICMFVYITSLSFSFYMLFCLSMAVKVCMSLNRAHMCESVKQEQRECQNSRRRIWGSNNRDWQRQTEKQHHKHMLTNQKDSDVLTHQTARCTTLISLRI